MEGKSEGIRASIHRKSCAVVVAYNKAPDLTKIIETLKEGELDALYISEYSFKSNIITDINRQIPEVIKNKVRILMNSENLGISNAFNSLFRVGLKEGCYYFHILDDDAVISSNLFSIERKWYENLEKSGRKIGVVCPIVSNDQTMIDVSPEHFPPFDRIKYFINSGSMISADALKIVKEYNESYYAEAADTELSIRMREEGLELFRINTILVTQEFGKNMNADSSAKKLYNFVLRYIVFLSLKLNTGNILPLRGWYYSPEREKRIRNTTLKMIWLEYFSNIDTGYRFGPAKRIYYVFSWIEKTIKYLGREILLSFIFREPRYLQEILICPKYFEEKRENN